MPDSQTDDQQRGSVQYSAERGRVMNDFLLIQPRPENLGGQPILRPLPSAKCRSVGPFVFFDHILENTYPAGSGMNINQHPHIGLSTLTYLFKGQLQHKDSLGSNQLVSPGEVSWMTAGRAVAHVERTPPVLSPTIYAEIKLAAGSALQIPAEHAERALYLIDGEATLDDQQLPLRGLLVLPEGETYTLSACSESHLVLIGGKPIGPRRINWNFVASDPALIDQARQRWAAQDWPTVPGETDRIELPR